MSSRFQFVDDHRGVFDVKWLCRILQVSRSGFYRWLAGADARAARAQADAELAECIGEIHRESDGTYAVPRVTAELRDGGERVNHKRVERVMRKFNIVGLHLRKKVRTTIPEPSATPVPDLLRRDFTAQAPNTKYVGDITYLPIGGGQFLYLATVLDLCSKWLAGWSIADHMRTELVTDALRAAAAARGAEGQRGVIFHSDNGAQYVSKEFAQVCSDLSVTRSRGAVGTSADNATVESLNATMKRETLQGRKRWNGAREARLAVFRWATRYNTPADGTPASARSARSPTSSDQLRWLPPHDNRCPRSRGRPRRPGCRVGCAPGSTAPVGVVLLAGTGTCRSAGVREDVEPVQGIADYVGPGPVPGQAEVAAAAGGDELRGGGEQPKPKAAGLP